MAFMRHNNNGRRHNNNNRHRHNGNTNAQQQGQRRHVNRVNHVFESNGPEGRVRGTAQQIVEKYMTMARDAQGAGDKVLSMNYFQHAEHYQRLLNEIQEENAVFERERDATRAAQQASQPDISADDADNGFADNGSSDQNSDNNAQDASDNQQPRAYQNARPQRAPQQRTQQPRAPRPQQNDDDLNTLPGFLQVPITESAPPLSVKPAAKAAASADGETAEAKPRVVRTPRARRVAPAASEADSAE